jgi:O-antigen/teichoic acid export membrane protein
VTVVHHLRHLVRDFLRYGAAHSVSQVVAFLLLPLLAHRLPVEELGVVDVVTVAASLAALSLRWELPAALARYFSRSEEEERRRLASALLTLVALLGSVAVAAFWPLRGVASARLLGSPRYAEILVLALVIGWLRALSSVPQMILRLDRRVAAWAATQILPPLVSLGLILVSLLVLGRGVAGIFEAQAAGWGVGLLLALLLARGKIGGALWSASLPRALGFALPLVPERLLAWLGNQLYRLILLVAAGLSAVAVFGVALKVAGIAIALGAVLQSTWQPYAMLLVEAGERDETYRLSFNYFAGLMVVAGIALSAVAPELVALLAPPDYAGAALLVPLVLGGLALRQSVMFTRLGILASERTHWQALARAMTVAVGFPLGLWLVGLWGTVGAAFAFLVSGLALTSLIGGISARVSSVRFDLRTLLMLLLTYGLSAGGLVAVEVWAPGSSPLWRLSIASAGVSGAVVVLRRWGRLALLLSAIRSVGRTGPWRQRMELPVG